MEFSDPNSLVLKLLNIPLVNAKVSKTILESDFTFNSYESEEKFVQNLNSFL